MNNLEALHMGVDMKVTNKKLSDEAFFKEREEVLAQWPTGKEVNLHEAIAYHKSLPAGKNYARKLAWAKQTGTTLIRTDSGVPSIEEHIEYLKYLEIEGGTELLGTMVDSFTRTQQYEAAGKGLEESLRTGKWLLNGVPVVNYGPLKLRKIVEAVKAPVAIRGNALDWRLIIEVGLAGGHSGTSSSPMMSFWHYSRNAPLEMSIHNHQYIFRLVGLYEESGIPISANMGGGFTIICPYSVIHAAAIIDALIAAEQGVKNIHLGVKHQGHLAQDIAAATTLVELSQYYLDKMGYKDIVVTICGNAWSGKFPSNQAEAFAVICLSVVTSVISRVQVAHVKTVEEAIGIPTREGNAASLRAGKKVIDMLKDQKIHLDDKAVATEAEIIKLETKAIMEKVLEIGDGDVAIGAMRAIEAGVLDNPFATTQYVAGRIMGVRDNEGAVRYLDCGNLPFTREIVDFNRSKIAAREKAQGKKVDYGSVVHDLFSISTGSLVIRQ